MGKNIAECQECTPEKTIKDCYTKKETCCGDNPCNEKYDCDCVVRIGSDCVHYSGPDMEETHIKKGDILTDVLIKTRSYMENMKTYLENKMNLQNRGKGLEVFRGENALGFKEFRTLTASGGTKVTISNDNDEIDIFTPKAIEYKVLTQTKGKSLIQEIKKVELLVETILKGLKSNKSIDIVEEKNDLTLSVNEAYLMKFVEEAVGPAMGGVTTEIEQLVKEITEKIETFDTLIDKKLEDARKEIDAIIKEMQDILDALGIDKVNTRLDSLEAKTAFVKKGIVFIWNAPANTIPKGFRECKDLSGRIPVGYLNTSPNFNLIGKQGGAESFTMDPAHMPPHSHKGKTKKGGGIHSHRYKDSYWIDKYGGYDTLGGRDSNLAPVNVSRGEQWGHSPTIYWREGVTGHDGEHEHEIEISSSGAGAPLQILNPYRVVTYIEYIG